MALKSYSVLDILLPSITIIRQDYSQALNSYVCTVSCGGVVNMLLVLSITFHFHYNIWGRMCSTGPFQYGWLKGYIYSSCYYDNQIGSIHLSHCYHIFPWLCAWDVCYIIFCHLLHIRSGKNREFVFIILVQFMMSANIRIRFGLQIILVRLYNTSSHYHHCANLFEGIELIKCLSDIFGRVWVRLSIFSPLSIIQYVGLYGFSLPILLVMIEIIYIYFVLLS